MTTNNAQTDIFSTFGLIDEHAEKLRKEEEQKKKEMEERHAKAAALQKQVNEANANKTKASKPATKAEVPFTPNEDTVIRYYGESFAITSYFTPEELAEGLLVKKKDDETERKPLTEELLRKRMEKDFPELVKDFTEIIYLKDKNIVVPTMKAKKKGNCGEVLSSDSTSPFSIKIPFAILRDFIALAKLYGKPRLEVHGDIYFKPSDRSYFLDIPEQRIHCYWTEVTESSYSIAERIQLDAIKVAEIHSHHEMRPLPSVQDNESERIPGMHYIIVGHTDRFFPEVFLRQFISEAAGHIDKKFSSLFEDPFFELPSFDMDGIVVESQ